MTLPSFPNQGATNWYSWAQAIHEAIEQGGLGASDEAVAALVVDTASDTAVALRAASVAAIEDAETVAATGAWNFTTAPTVDGDPIGAPERFYLSQAKLDVTNSAVVTTSGGSTRPYALRDANNDHIGAEILFPPSWSTFNCYAKLEQLLTTAGNVVLRLDYKRLGHGADVNGTLNTGPQVTVALPATQWQVVVAQIATSAAVDPSGETLQRVMRLGSDAADTLAGSVGLLGLLFERAS